MAGFQGIAHGAGHMEQAVDDYAGWMVRHREQRGGCLVKSWSRRFCVARSKQVCIYVVEALLIAIYLPKGQDVYIHIRPTSVPEATVVQLSLDS
jgi:hypothetical protein